AEEIKRFYQAARADAHERIPIFRLAWDTALSAFATRQVLYERYFFGDPVRMAGALVRSHDFTPYMDMIRDFLARAGEEALAQAED
ncbi:MAG TPA: 4-hydroxyphenylacetate 3-hydroxylase C-terminal domain-containing protein, partial [Anaerolineales bacterium]|nr:4-hydroxyphenylacetate 3-hydroxylase C-terminal domain-containing protein [Anaerolineales bacterium]